MTEPIVVETEKKVAMEYAIRLVHNINFVGTEARKLAAEANLVSVLYRAIIGYEEATPEAIEALLKASN